MAKIIDVDVLDNFKLRQDAVNDAWFLKRSNIEKEGNEIKIVAKEATSSQSEVSYMALTTESEIDASQITGVLDIDNIPPSAQERLVNVNGDNPASWGLTSNDVQKGDVVRVNSGDNTGKMYYVVDENNLNNTNGYKEFKAIVDWDSIKNKPTSFSSAAHTHGNITNDGKISGTTTAGLPIVTTTGGKITYGSTSTYAAGTHTHGDITSDGKISGTTTAGLPIVTTTGGKITYGSTSTYAAGTHTHGNITSDGKINATAVTSSSPVVLTSDGTITRGIYESSIDGMATINAPQCIAVKNYVDNRSRIFVSQQTNPNTGDIYYDTTDNVLKIYVNGWITIGSGGSSSGGGSSTGGNTTVEFGDNLEHGNNIILQAYNSTYETYYNLSTGTAQTPDGQTCYMPVLQISSDGVNFSDVAGYQPGCAYCLGHSAKNAQNKVLIYVILPVISIDLNYMYTNANHLYFMQSERIQQIADDIAALEGYNSYEFNNLKMTDYTPSICHGTSSVAYGTKYFKFNFRNDDSFLYPNYPVSIAPNVSDMSFTEPFNSTNVLYGTNLYLTNNASNAGDIFNYTYGHSNAGQSFYYGFGMLTTFTLHIYD